VGSGRRRDSESAEGTLAALTPGLQVRIASGALEGNVYKYKGDAQTASDLSLQPYGDGHSVGPVNVITSESVGGKVVDALTPGMKVRMAGGVLAGDIYEYVGPALTDSDPNAEGVQKFDLSVQQYRDASLWKQANMATGGAQIRAGLKESSLRATGALTIDAEAAASIDATVIAAAVGVGGGGTTGVAVSGAGSYAENKIKTDVKAYIDGDGANATTDGIEAGSVALYAEDCSGIDAIAARDPSPPASVPRRACRWRSVCRSALTRSTPPSTPRFSTPMKASPRPTAAPSRYPR